MAKKIIVGVMMMIMLAGCGKAETTKKDPKTIDLTEDKLIQWVNEIKTNPDSYIGDIIHLEGLYLKEGNTDVRNKYGYVYRRGLGCCSTDGGTFGFEFIFDDYTPKDGEWIDVTGVLSSYEENGEKRLVLKADSVEKKDEYGEIFLAQ